jgi:hypothetical protein
MGFKSLARYLTKVLSKFIGPKRVLVIEAKLRFYKNINIEDPVKLSDKIVHLEFYDNNSLVIKCSDKYEVRQYVKSKGLEDILIPTIDEYYTNVNDINFDNLPNKFVIKATHGSKMNIICTDKNQLNLRKARIMLKKWLKNDFERSFMEPHYQKIPHRIICEKYL